MVKMATPVHDSFASQLAYAIAKGIEKIADQTETTAADVNRVKNALMTGPQLIKNVQGFYTGT